MHFPSIMMSTHHQLGHKTKVCHINERICWFWLWKASSFWNEMAVLLVWGNYPEILYMVWNSAINSPARGNSTLPTSPKCLLCDQEGSSYLDKNTPHAIVFPCWTKSNFSWNVVFSVKKSAWWIGLGEAAKNGNCGWMGSNPKRTVVWTLWQWFTSHFHPVCKHSKHVKLATPIRHCIPAGTSRPHVEHIPFPCAWQFVTQSWGIIRSSIKISQRHNGHGIDCRSGMMVAIMLSTHVMHNPWPQGSIPRDADSRQTGHWSMRGFRHAAFVFSARKRKNAPQCCDINGCSRCWTIRKSSE